MDVSIDVSGPVAVSEIKRNDTCMSVEVDGCTVYLHGNSGALRAFFEAGLMACPPRAIVGQEVAQ